MPECGLGESRVQILKVEAQGRQGRAQEVAARTCYKYFVPTLESSALTHRKVLNPSAQKAIVALLHSHVQDGDRLGCVSAYLHGSRAEEQCYPVIIYTNATHPC